MGSTKKHKEKDKEHKKKKKHKERSRSKSPKDKKYKKHKKRSHEDEDYEGPDSKRSRDMDVPDSRSFQLSDRHRLRHAEAYFDDDLEAHAYMDSERNGRTAKSDNRAPLKAERADASPPVVPGASSGGDSSLSIEETNRLRAKLGLKPLDVKDKSAGDAPSKGSGGLQEDIHVPAVNIANVKKQQNIKEKLLAAREKRLINQKLGKVKTLADDSDDDDALAWVKRSRRAQREKELAEKRAKILDQMDEDFGIGDLVAEEFGTKKKQPEYSSKDLRGLKVDHDQESFSEGKTIILTLKDKGILDEDNDDVLENVNMLDSEKAKENIENKKKKLDYKPYDEPEMDEYGMIKSRDILEKYDEEIDGKKKETFALGSGGKYDASHEKRMEEMRRTLKQQGQALSLPPPTLAREFYTEDEMAGFKKVKKKVRKIRKKPKAVTADDLLPLDNEPGQDHGSRRRRREQRDDPEEEGEVTEAIPGLDLIEAVKHEEEEILGPDEDLSGVVVEDEAGIELELALTKARKLKSKTQPNLPEKVADNIEVKEESAGESEDEEVTAGSSLSLPTSAAARNIKLNQTSEFCRSLGEISTYRMAGNRLEEEEDELMDFERTLEEEERLKAEQDSENPAGWQQVEIDTRPVDITTNKEQRVLDDEPLLNEGIGAALNLATRKGLLEHETTKIIRAQKGQTAEIENQNYSIEDKRYDDLDEKFRKRDRFGGGIVSDFKEKTDYKPEIKIDYIDDQGRNMSAKEAFRYLSHRFHGKGSGKLKTEKRNKKYDQEQLLKSMTSNDTPLHTASMLTKKLKQESTPYLLLSGANKSQQPSLMK